MVYTNQMAPEYPQTPHRSRIARRRVAVGAAAAAAFTMASVATAVVTAPAAEAGTAHATGAASARVSLMPLRSPPKANSAWAYDTSTPVCGSARSRTTTTKRHRGSN